MKTKKEKDILSLILMIITIAAITWAMIEISNRR